MPCMLKQWGQWGPDIVLPLQPHALQQHCGYPRKGIPFCNLSKLFDTKALHVLKVVISQKRIWPGEMGSSISRRGRACVKLESSCSRWRDSDSSFHLHSLPPQWPVTASSKHLRYVGQTQPRFPNETLFYSFLHPSSSLFLLGREMVAQSLWSYSHFQCLRTSHRVTGCRLPSLKGGS